MDTSNKENIKVFPFAICLSLLTYYNFNAFLVLTFFSKQVVAAVMYVYACVILIFIFNLPRAIKLSYLLGIAALVLCLLLIKIYEKNCFPLGTYYLT